MNDNCTFRAMIAGFQVACFLALGIASSAAGQTAGRNESKSVRQATQQATRAAADKLNGGKLASEESSREKLSGEKLSGEKLSGEKLSGEERGLSGGVRPLQAGVAASAMTSEREAAALEFVSTHHPELSALLPQLRESQPAEFQKAVRDLARTNERLLQMKANDSARYELELALWKMQSQIALLAAHLRMSDDERLRDLLRQRLAEKLATQKALLEHDRLKAQERIDRLTQQIDRLDGQSEQMVERQMELLLRADKPMKTNRPKAARDKPATNAGGEVLQDGRRDKT